jgi:hypothetical protein
MCYINNNGELYRLKFSASLYQKYSAKLYIYHPLHTIIK